MNTENGLCQIWMAASTAGHVDVLERMCEYVVQKEWLTGRWVSTFCTIWPMSFRHLYEFSAYEATKAGQLCVLEWLKVKKFRIQHYTDTLCELAAKCGHPHVISWLMDQGGGICYHKLAKIAARHEHMNVLHWLRDHNYKWAPNDPWHHDDEDGIMVTWFAAKQGDVSVLAYAVRNGAPATTTTWEAAAYHGHIIILAWARDHGYAFSSTLCSTAVRGEQFETLEWLYEQGCPMEKGTCEEAIRKGRVDILKWARSHGCPWDERVYMMGFFSTNPDIQRWVKSQGSKNFLEIIPTPKD